MVIRWLMEKFHVLYIHTHDSGQVFSPYGYQVPTEQLLDFSKDAVVFDHAFCASPTCSPSRSALVTGTYPHRNGMMGLGNRGFCLKDYKEHMANVFARQGYATVLCGIQHEYGRYVDHQNSVEKIGYEYDITASCASLREAQMVGWDRKNVENFDCWLKTYKDDRPFFASFGFFSTHREYPPVPEAFKDMPVKLPGFLEDYDGVKEDFRGHIESLKWFDEGFGMLIDSLKKTGFYENTVIFFTSDHGIPYPRAKCTLYDAGIQVALIMRIPGRPQGFRVPSLVSQVDILPTLCKILKLEAGHPMDGIDFSPLFSRPDSIVRNDIFAEVNFHTSYEPIRCIRTKDYKYIRYYDMSYLEHNLSNVDNSLSKQLYMERGLLTGRKEEEQFYCLRDDRYEKNNRIHDKSYGDIIQELRERLFLLEKETKDPLLDGAIKIQKNWVVNVKECINPKSRNPSDFLN